MFDAGGIRIGYVLRLASMLVTIMPVIYHDPPDFPDNPPGTPSAPPGSPSPPDSPLPPAPALPPLSHPPPAPLLVNAPRQSEHVLVPPQTSWLVPNAAQYRNPPPVPCGRDPNQGVTANQNEGVDADQNEGVEQADSAMSFAQHPLLELVDLSSTLDLPEPLTHREAMSRVDTPWWKEACEEFYCNMFVFYLI